MIKNIIILIFDYYTKEVGEQMEEEFVEVIFLDSDRISVLDTQIVKNGSKVEYKGKKPTKEPTLEGTYTFSGWINEEKLECVTEKLILIAKYDLEVSAENKDAMYNASLENAENSNLNETIEAGKKVSDQQNAIEKDSRNIEEIVNDILENGQTEIGENIDKDIDIDDFEK
jgi:hypothetical protein